LLIFVIHFLPQAIPRKDEQAVKPTISLDSSVINLPSDVQGQAGTSNIGGEHNAAYPQHLYSPQAQPFYYQGEVKKLLHM
jgi:hypothetical protein